MPKRAGCIISCNGYFLIVHQPSSGFWGFPKGHLLPNEPPEYGAIREVYEEVGIGLAREQLGRDYRYKDSLFFTVRLTRFPLVNVDYMEIDGYRWAQLYELTTLPISNVTRQLIKKLDPVLQLHPGCKYGASVGMNRVHYPRANTSR